MEWSREKTLKLISLLQLKTSLWNPSLCDSRREKQKRKQELRSIASVFGISTFDVTKKIQHLRTQYNRESTREAIVHAEDPTDRYITNWYAYDYLHFLKDSSKPYRVIQSEDLEVNNSVPSNNEQTFIDCKLDNLTPPPPKIPRTDNQTINSDALIAPDKRDEFAVFGEYVANELRSLKGEKNLLVAKKKIQDVIFEVKMNMFSETREQPCIFSPVSQPQTTMSSEKIYSTPVISTLTTQAPPTSALNEIIINGACHYTTFKVDDQ